MNIMQKLTLRQMLLNKRRTIVTIIGIMFSVALITAVSTFFGSFMDVFKQAEIATKGEWHVQYAGVAKSDVSKIAQDSNTKSYASLYNRGFVQLDSETAMRPYLMNLQMNPEGFVQQQITLLEGHLPQTASEIVISKELAEDFPEQYQVGKTVSLELGKRIANPREEDGNLTEEERTLKWSSSYLGKDGETFVKTETSTVTIVGIVDAPVYAKSYFPGYTTFSALDLNALPQDTTFDVMVAVKNVDKSIYPRSEALMKTLSQGEFYYNSSFLAYSGVSDDDSMLTTLYLVIGIVIFIVVVGAIALVYNSFAISVSERSVNFGMLSGFGATARQKRHSVLFEALILSCIGIPLGLGLGFAGMGVTLAIVNPMFTNILNVRAQNVTLHLVILPSAVLAAILISLVTIFLSAWIPAVRASRITPIDAIRKSKDVKLTSKEVKTPKIIRTIFGFEAELALKNLKRNKKRYRITIVSLILSLVLFLSASSFTHYLTYTYDMAKHTINYDINAFLSMSKNQNYKEEKKIGNDILNEMTQISGIDEWTSYFTKELILKADRSMVSSAVADYWTEGMQDDLDINVLFMAMDEASLRKYAKDVGVDYNALTDPSNPKAIVVNQVDYVKGHHVAKISFLNKKVGDSISLYNSNRESNRTGEGGTLSRENLDLVEITLAALTDQVPMGVNSQVDSPNNMVIIVSQEVFDQVAQDIPDTLGTQVTGDDQVISDENAVISPLSAMLVLNSEDDKAVTKEMERILEKYRQQDGIGGSVYNISSEAETVNQMVLIVNIFTYGFITLISLIGIANIFNTISTSLALRKRESAMMKSIGMSPKSFRKMINFESLFYGLKTVVYGLPIGFGVMGLIYWALRRNFDMPFTIPWGNLICGVAGIFLIVVLTMLYSSSKLKKENVIDILRNENV
ncbi:MAG: ABC transporter permease [Clostridiales bacterium]|jgi:putative ABC transport system permease protein|nr:ABC transporter permease [Clostridiales bacterium]